MKLKRCVLSLVLIASILQAHPRDAKSTFDLIKKGGALSTRDAERLEDRLKKKPGDEEARVQLLSFYAGPPPGLDLATVRAARSKHILWLIENDPQDGLGLFQVATGVYRINCQGDELADADVFEQASQKWLEQL